MGGKDRRGAKTRDVTYFSSLLLYFALVSIYCNHMFVLPFSHPHLSVRFIRFSSFSNYFSLFFTMTKRARSSSLENDSVSHPSPKKSHSNNAAKNAYIKVATQENAAVADKHTPLSKLNNLLKKNSKVNSPKGDAVVYWMRMEDMRSNCHFHPLFSIGYSLSMQLLITGLCRTRLRRLKRSPFHSSYSLL